jgi:hypothetical protein
MHVNEIYRIIRDRDLGLFQCDEASESSNQFYYYTGGPLGPLLIKGLAGSSEWEAWFKEPPALNHYSYVPLIVFCTIRND